MGGAEDLVGDEIGELNGSVRRTRGFFFGDDAVTGGGLATSHTHVNLYSHQSWLSPEGPVSREGFGRFSIFDLRLKIEKREIHCRDGSCSGIKNIFTTTEDVAGHRVQSSI